MNVKSTPTSLQAGSPKVSWLLCTHQENELLHRAIRSCLNQTLDDFELLLIVNGIHADKLALSLQGVYGRDMRVRVIDTPIYLLNFSLSLGLHLARAPLVARMDADDVSAPDRLERQFDFMERHPSVAVLGSAYELMDADGHVHGKVSPPETDREIRSHMHYQNPMCHPSVMLRRQVIVEMGGYLGGKNAEDYDLWLRLALDSNWQFANMSEVLLSYNASPKGEARRSRTAYSNAAGAQLRNFLVTRDLRWLLGSALSAGKSVMRATRA
ncbi:glycosyltransferase [Hydrogenophaga sp. PBL-H3]|uniref:glycosyltransferase n=1 Tax=Hydrogenophaga sp. PBL-H3 TaxID=434010 RepID=UPI00135C5708|nr:glycosyltransferase [Hydrogenophaga sp. PBL-H3]